MSVTTIQDTFRFIDPHAGYGNILEPVFKEANTIFQTSINKNTFEADCTSYLGYLDQLAPTGLTRYIQAHSFYPALLEAMQTKNYDPVFNFFALIPPSLYIKLETPEIRLCKVACLLQLKKCAEFTAAFKECQQKEDLFLLDHLIFISDFGLKEAYQQLKQETNSVDSSIIAGLANLNFKV